MSAGLPARVSARPPFPRKPETTPYVGQRSRAYRGPRECDPRGAGMRRIVCREFGPPEHLRLEVVPDPKPGPGEVLVKVHAAGVSFVDGLIVGGMYQLKPSLPFTPGLVGAGEVLTTGAGVPDLAAHDGRCERRWAGAGRWGGIGPPVLRGCGASRAAGPGRCRRTRGHPATERRRRNVRPAVPGTRSSSPAAAAVNPPACGRRSTAYVGDLRSRRRIASIRSALAA